MEATFEQAKAFFLQGLAHYEAGRWAQAEAQFAASLALVPGRASTLTNLGATRIKLGQFEQAADLLREAVAADPTDAQALGHLATALAELGRTREALQRAQQALQLNDQLGALWSLRGNLLRELGRGDEAAQSYRKAIERGADAELNRYYLAALQGGEAPRAAPRPYVEQLFDGYADGFEEHLVAVLNYQAPQILAAGLEGRRFERALDLGCGTGLCGLALRPLTGRLEAVDLSANMVQRARDRGVYDEVVHADLVEFLSATPQRYDLVVAADVFIYVGALEEVFRGVARVLSPQGIFAFSVELASGKQDLELRQSLRYAHSRGYIQKLAAQHGFEISATQDHPIRDDQRTPLPGMFAWLLRH